MIKIFEIFRLPYITLKNAKNKSITLPENGPFIDLFKAFLELFRSHSKSHKSL